MQELNERCFSSSAQRRSPTACKFDCWHADLLRRDYQRRANTRGVHRGFSCPENPESPRRFQCREGRKWGCRSTCAANSCRRPAPVAEQAQQVPRFGSSLACRQNLETRVGDVRLGWFPRVVALGGRVVSWQGLAGTSWPPPGPAERAFRNDCERLTNKGLPLPLRALSRTSPKTSDGTHFPPIPASEYSSGASGSLGGANLAHLIFPVDLVPLSCNKRCCNILGARVNVKMTGSCDRKL